MSLARLSRQPAACLAGLLVASVHCAPREPAAPVDEVVIPGATPVIMARCSPSGAPVQPYPARYPRMGPEAAAARAEEMRRASGGLFESVSLDPYGFVIGIRTRPWEAFAGPTKRLRREDLAPWTASMSCFPGQYGVAGEHVDALFAEEGNTLGAWQILSGQRVGRLTVAPFADWVLPAGAKDGPRERRWGVQMSGHLWPGAPDPPRATVHAADVEARLLGASYDTISILGPPPCAHGAKCEMPPPLYGTTTVTQAMIHAVDAMVLVRPRDDAPVELRRVLRVDLVDKRYQSTRFTPREGAPQVPHIVDSVTGEDLRTWQWCHGTPISCYDWSTCGAGSCGLN